MTILRPAVSVLLLLTLVTGVLYPLLTTVVGKTLFPTQAQGSLIKQGETVKGSLLIGQAFTQPGYFQSRPSATADHPDNPLASGGSNLAQSHPQLMTEVEQRVATLRAQNPSATGKIPTELLTTSASGLEPMLSVAAVDWQIPRVAQARHLSVEELQHLVQRFTQAPLLSFMGPPVVNLVALNLALDQYHQGK